MSKNKKRKRDTPQPRISGYKKFLIDMQEALKFTRVDILLKDIPDKYKRMMYSYRMLVSNPVAANALTVLFTPFFSPAPTVDHVLVTRLNFAILLAFNPLIS